MESQSPKTSKSSSTLEELLVPLYLLDRWGDDRADRFCDENGVMWRIVERRDLVVFQEGYRILKTLRCLCEKLPE